MASHDRGARVAHRLVLDHPGTVTKLAVLDVLPTVHVLHNVTREVAANNYHWFFMAAGNGTPEQRPSAPSSARRRASTLAHDEESADAGHKIECPVLVLWGEQGL